AHGWPSAALTPYRLEAGRAPAASDEIVVDAPLARAGHIHVGTAVKLVTPAGTTDARVSGIATAARSQLDRQWAVFLTEQRAQQLSGLGPGFNAIAVRADAALSQTRLTREIASAVGGDAQVLDHRHAAAADAGDPRAYDRIELVAVIASSGGVTLGIAVLLPAGTAARARADPRNRRDAVAGAADADDRDRPDRPGGRRRGLLCRERAVWPVRPCAHVGGDRPRRVLDHADVDPVCDRDRDQCGR